MKYGKIDSSLFINNRKRLHTHLSTNSIAIVHSNDTMPKNGDGIFPFKQNSDLFYLSGIEQEETILLIYPDAKKNEWKEILFIKNLDTNNKIWEGDSLTQEEASNISGIKTILWISEFKSTFQNIMSYVDNVYLNSNEHMRLKSDIQTKSNKFISFCKAKYPLHSYKRLAPSLARLRSIKSDIEIDLIRQACLITEKGFRRILPLIKSGMMEYEIEAELACEFLKNAATGFAYTPIIASGKNSCILHYHANNTKTKKGEIILLDIGAEYANYGADVTRVFPINGKFTTEQKKLYKSVLFILHEAKRSLKVGLTIEAYQASIIELVKEELNKLGLLTASNFQFNKNDNQYRKYFMHGVIHHLGLDTHDWACYDMLIQPNMVFAIEPAIYIGEENIGIRLEDNCVVRADGIEDLTSSIPLDIDEIEELMSK